MKQKHTNQGDNVGRDKIGRQTNMGDQGTYIENQIIEGQKQIPKHLTPLQKTNPDNIIGRTVDLTNLRQQLQDQHQIVVVNGIGGVGKTTLAEAYIFQYENDYEHIAWITNNADALSDDFVQNASLMRNLGIDAAGIDPKALFTVLCDALRNLSGSPNLLVMDNADASAKNYLDILPKPPNWHVLFTSREKIPHVTPIDLSTLKPEEAKALFKKHCTSITDDAAIDALTKSVEYHTLTIEILAKTAENRFLSADELKNAIEKDIKANIHTKHAGTNKTERVTSYLLSIFNMDDLENPHIWLLQQFACLPPEYFEFEELKAILNRPYEQKFCMQPECPFLPTLRHILAFVAKATRLRVFLG